ncbi:hematopoietic cell signal transducer isoform X2 [Lampris incognitus]|uniref:hematopoietic cell signal transducer isoform X2 n=1 Tax=Lampris incognitus TaxID=2546036 RepID=UPI0024B4C2DD|nr:hematopoietic cell signal transducer isoform X2 [Lampris incognitus]
MADNIFYVALLLSLHSFAMAERENSHCYRIEPGTMAGVITADVVLTIVTVIVTYVCASRRRWRKDNANAVYMNVRANCKI